MTAALLRELVRASSEPVDVAPARVDWNALIDSAERHHLAPLALEGLRSLAIDPPTQHRERLENIRNLELAKAVVRLHHVDELRAAASATGTSLCLLKGAAFALTLYRDPGLRPMSDIDVLVSRESFERFSRAVQDLGYALADASDHATAYRKGTTGVVVEIHRELTSAPAFLGMDVDSILERSRSLGGSLTTLSWEDHLLHLCLHGSFQHGFRQPGVNAWDARLIAEREAFDMETFITRASEGRLAPWVYGGLAMTAAVFETPRLRSTLSALSELVSHSVVTKASRFRAEELLSPERDSVFGSPWARVGWTGWNLTTLSLLSEVSRPRANSAPSGLRARAGRIIQLIRNHGLALVGPTANTPPALSMGPTSASLGEVRDV